MILLKQKHHSAVAGITPTEASRLFPESRSKQVHRGQKSPGSTDGLRPEGKQKSQQDLLKAVQSVSLPSLTISPTPTERDGEGILLYRNTVSIKIKSSTHPDTLVCKMTSQIIFYFLPGFLWGRKAERGH